MTLSKLPLCDTALFKIATVQCAAVQCRGRLFGTCSTVLCGCFGNERKRVERFLALRISDIMDIPNMQVMHVHGGVYADADVECLLPIVQWLPAGCNVLLAPENNVHLAQWTIVATAGHPLMGAIVEHVLLSISGAFGPIDMTFQHVVHKFTGPGIFTEAIVKWFQIQENNFTDPQEHTMHPGTMLSWSYERRGPSQNGVCFAPQSGWQDGYLRNKYGSMLPQTSASGVKVWTSWTVQRKAYRPLMAVWRMRSHLLLKLVGLDA